MHCLNFIAFVLAACGIASAFNCPPEKPHKYCATKQDPKQGGNGNWYCKSNSLACRMSLLPGTQVTIKPYDDICILP
jgi:hypothetical protein